MPAGSPLKQPAPALLGRSSISGRRSHELKAADTSQKGGGQAAPAGKPFKVPANVVVPVDDPMPLAAIGSPRSGDGEKGQDLTPHVAGREKLHDRFRDYK